MKGPCLSFDGAQGGQRVGSEDLEISSDIRFLHLWSRGWRRRTGVALSMYAYRLQQSLFHMVPELLPFCGEPEVIEGYPPFPADQLFRRSNSAPCQRRSSQKDGRTSWNGDWETKGHRLVVFNMLELGTPPAAPLM